MDALMATLTRGDRAVPSFDKLAQLLGYLGLSQTEGSGYAFDPDGWQNLFAVAGGTLSDGKKKRNVQQT